MSKKKSTIIDDDPLAWLKEESEESNVEVQEQMFDADAQSDAEEQTSDELLIMETAEEIISDTDGAVCEEEKIDNIEVSSIKEKVVAADSKEEMLAEINNMKESEAVTQAEISKTDIKHADSHQADSNDEEQTMITDDNMPQLNENGEESIAMATSNSEKIVLEEDVCIVQVAALKEAWLPVLDSGKDISINAEAVEDIDTAGLQLLLSLVKTAKDSGRSVTWDSPSETIVNAVKETSLRDAMGFQL